MKIYGVSTQEFTKLCDAKNMQDGFMVQIVLIFYITELKKMVNQLLMKVKDSILVNN